MKSLDVTRVIYVYFTSLPREIVLLLTSILRQCHSPRSINNQHYHSIHFINKPFTIGIFEKSDNFSPFCLAVQQLYFTSLI